MRARGPAVGAGADAAQQRAEVVGLPQQPVHAVGAPDREEVGRVAAAHVHDVLGEQEGAQGVVVQLSAEQGQDGGNAGGA